MVEKICRKKIGTQLNIGEPVYVLGYPGVGGDSLTLTQGVVSGFTGDYEQYIKISANTNFGNSGGVAIDGQGCYLGIPSQLSTNGTGTLGLVLAGQFKNDFINGTTGEYTYTPPASTTDETEYLNQTFEFPDFSIRYPDQWTLSTSSPDETGVWDATFSAPIENAVADMSAATTVYVHPGMSSADYTAALTQSDARARTVDPSAHIRNITLGNGLNTHQLIYTDSTGDTFPDSVLVYAIAFRRNGTVYSINSVAPLGPTNESYLYIFAHMGNSITVTK
jgi:hypothetical protein